jgi:hypothetical protein
MINSVLKSTKELIENPKYVKINRDKVKEVAERFSKDDLQIPKWDAPVFPEAKDKSTIDFLLLANTINFAFTNFETKEKYVTNYKDISWAGAFGMFASLNRVVDNGEPILEGDYLSKILFDDMNRIFEKDSFIPMFEERIEIFQEVGDVLCKKYDGHFYNVVEASDNKLFNNGKGLVERLTNDFPSFNDAVVYNGKLVRFDKRAQLGAAMLYGKFQGTDMCQFEDVDKLTVFADYVLPKGLRDLGIFGYSPVLATEVDNLEVLHKESLKELEIRASTIHASDMLINEINDVRNGFGQINALHLDYKLWSESKKSKVNDYHLCQTIAY